MTENIDTYVMPEDSDRFLAEVLPTDDPLRMTWEVLTPEEKEGYLSAGLRNLEKLTYVGNKVYYSQPLKFPRIARNVPPDFEKAPLEVKRAQVLWAAEIMRDELYVKRRNTDACIALGLIKDSAVSVQSRDMPINVKELLHRWITAWRKI